MSGRSARYGLILTLIAFLGSGTASPQMVFDCVAVPGKESSGGTHAKMQVEVSAVAVNILRKDIQDYATNKKLNYQANVDRRSPTTSYQTLFDANIENVILVISNDGADLASVEIYTPCSGGNDWAMYWEDFRAFLTQKKYRLISN